MIFFYFSFIFNIYIFFRVPSSHGPFFSVNNRAGMGGALTQAEV